MLLPAETSKEAQIARFDALFGPKPFPAVYLP